MSIHVLLKKFFARIFISRYISRYIHFRVEIRIFISRYISRYIHFRVQNRIQGSWTGGRLRWSPYSL